MLLFQGWKEGMAPESNGDLSITTETNSLNSLFKQEPNVTFTHTNFNATHNPDKITELKYIYI